MSSFYVENSNFVRRSLDLLVLLLFLFLSLLFQAFLRSLLTFFYPSAFFSHDTLLPSDFLCLGPSFFPAFQESP